MRSFRSKCNKPLWFILYSHAFSFLLHWLRVSHSTYWKTGIYLLCKLIAFLDGAAIAGEIWNFITSLAYKRNLCKLTGLLRVRMFKRITLWGWLSSIDLHYTVLINAGSHTRTPISRSNSPFTIHYNCFNPFTVHLLTRNDVWKNTMHLLYRN